MLLVRTKIGPSKIHGYGLFADQNIPKGTIVWKFNPVIDHKIRPEKIGSLLKHVQDHVYTYAYFDRGNYILCGDFAIFINHSKISNLDSRGEVGVATRSIKKGEEITDNYHHYGEKI